MKGRTYFLGVFALSLLLMVSFVAAQPLGAETADVIESSRFEEEIAPQEVDAQAGNVTELSLHGLSVTRHWQGFYGNITGEIVLADSSGNNFYDWNVSVPTGQVYASRNDAVSWDTILCPDVTDISDEAAALGQSPDDPDSVNNTFTNTDHPAFEVGGQAITGCPTTQAYNASGEQGNAFWQVLLKAGDDMVYTTIIEDTSPAGFDGLPWHFQLLVGEDGTDENPTPYYFYLELQ